MTDLLTVKELAAQLKRSPWYVYAMRRAGFRMPGGTATIEEAREWLRDREFSAKKAMKADPKSGNHQPIRFL